MYKLSLFEIPYGLQKRVVGTYGVSVGWLCFKVIMISRNSLI